MDKQQTSFFFRAIVWSCITLFYCYQYILRLLPNMIMPELMKQFSINAKDIGFFAGIYYIGYIAMYIPIGILLSRYGSKKILPFCIAFSAFGLLPIIYITSWQLVVLGRFFIGICSSAAIIGAFQSFRLLFPSNFAQVLGATVCIGIITAINISKPLLVIRDTIGMTSMLTWISIGGIILAVFSWIILPKEEKIQETSSIQMVKNIISEPLFWISSILAGLMVAPLEGFADTHATAFLFALYQIPRTLGDSIAFYILVGMCVGSIVLPYITEKTGRYYFITATCAYTMAFLFLCMFTFTLSSSLLYLMYFIIGVCSAYQVIILSKIASYYRIDLSGLAGAIANMIVMSFGSFFNTAIGFLLDYFWQGTMTETIRLYSSSAYIKAISIIPISLCIAGIGFLLISLRKEHREL